jgi:hypothetical protein
MFGLINLQYIIQGSSVLREKLTPTQPIINFPHFMKHKNSLYLCCPYRCVISRFSRCTILSNTTRKILIETHYTDDMFRLIFHPSSGLTQIFERTMITDTGGAKNYIHILRYVIYVQY